MNQFLNICSEPSSIRHLFRSLLNQTFFQSFTQSDLLKPHYRRHISKRIFFYLIDVVCRIDKRLVVGNHNNLTYSYAAHHIYKFQKLPYMPTVQENRWLVKNHWWEAICPISSKTESEKPVNSTAQDKVKYSAFAATEKFRLKGSSVFSVNCKVVLGVQFYMGIGIVCIHEAEHFV